MRGFLSKRDDEITVCATRKARLFVIHSMCLCEILHEQVCGSYRLPPKQLVEDIGYINNVISKYNTHFQCISTYLDKYTL